MSTSSTGKRAIALAAALLAMPSFADPLTWEGSTNLTMTANTTVDVPAGTTNVIDTLAGAYTLTKTGGGVLEVRYLHDAAAEIVVSNGLIRFSNPRPDDIFAKAYFHLDASDRSSLSIDFVNGTNFVTRWNDTDGRSKPYAVNLTLKTNPSFRPDPENRRAFLSDCAAATGLPAVNFGSLLSLGDVDGSEGYGAAMSFGDANSRNMSEGFTVACDDESLKTVVKSRGGPSFFGNNDGNMYGRREDTTGDGKTNPQIYYYHSSGPGSEFCSLNGTNYLDGVRLSTYKTKYPDGFHVLNTVPSQKMPCNALGRNYRNTGSTRNSFGGTRIGEFVIFGDVLDESERLKVSGYLCAKWLGQAARRVVVSDGASFDVDESANLTITTFKDEGAANLALTCATNVYNRALSGVGAYLHLDASQTNTMTLVEQNGTNFVTRWNDVDGGTMYVVPADDTGSSGQRTNPSQRYPFLNPSMTQNGLPFADLGSAIYVGYTNSEGVAIGYGGAFRFYSLADKYRAKTLEYLSVISDTEDLKTAPTGKDGPAYLPMYTGNSFSGQKAGRRGATVSGKNPAMFRTDNTQSTNCVNGGIYVNGESKQASYNPPDGFSVINLRPTSAVDCNMIGRALYRNTAGQVADTYGGHRIAEYMLFTSYLEDEKRQRIYNALRCKWFGDAPATTNFYNKLGLDAKSVMTVKYEAVAVTNKLTLAGVLAAPSVFAANVDVSGTNATVNAPLTVPDGAAFSFARQDDGAWSVLSVKSLAAEGVVRVVLAAAGEKGLGGTSARLVAAETPIESIDGWTLEWNGKHEATMSLRDGDVWVEFAKPGSIILFR